MDGTAMMAVTLGRKEWSGHSGEKGMKQPLHERKEALLQRLYMELYPSQM
jgi:hypothetical protein